MAPAFGDGFDDRSCRHANPGNDRPVVCPRSDAGERIRGESSCPEKRGAESQNAIWCGSADLDGIGLNRKRSAFGYGIGLKGSLHLERAAGGRGKHWILTGQQGNRATVAILELSVRSGPGTPGGID